MARTFGQFNPALTMAIRRVARDSANVAFKPHAEEEMDNDGFDHDDVLRCLRRGGAHGPENHGRNEVRSNVLYLGTHIRVVVGRLEDCEGDWTKLEKITVETVMRSD
jgi:hypothetical protein